MPILHPNRPYQKLLDTAKTARRPFDKETWLNWAFFMDRQYTEWYSKTDTIREIPKPKNMKNVPRPVSNKIKHFVLQEHAMTLNTRPTVDVLPAADDPQNVSDANVALAYLNWLADQQVADFDGVLSQATLWALSGTEAFIKWTWDPHLPNGNGGKGRGNMIPISPLDLFLDPYATSFYDARYAVHSRFLDVEQVYDIWGIEIKPNQIDASDPNRIAVMRDMGMTSLLEGATVNELWMKPSRRYPDGLFVVWSGNDQLVAPSPFPYKHGQLPFTQIGSVQWPGTTHYTSAVSSMRPAQMELNNYHAQMILIRQAFANPKWGIATELDMDELPDDSPNQVLRYNSMGGTLKPEIIQPTTMPGNDAGAWIRNEMMDIVGLHEVSQAQVPGRVEAAKAIELLKESDNGRLAELLRTIKKSIAVGFYQQLMLLKQYGDPDTMFMAYSREGYPEVKHMMTERLSPAMKIKITMTGGIGQSRAALEDRWMTMWDNGIIQDKDTMAQLLDVPVSTVSPDAAFDMRLARNENFKMAAGISIVPNSWDAHDIHRREHDNFRKTDEFAMLSMKSKQIFEMHSQFHDKLQIQQLGKQLQIQQMAAAVASGAGFQQPAQPGAQPGAASGATSGQSSAGAPPSGGPPSVPKAAGAAPPSDPYATRDTPQSAATYQNRSAQRLAGLPQ